MISPGETEKFILNIVQMEILVIAIKPSLPITLMLPASFLLFQSINLDSFLTPLFFLINYSQVIRKSCYLQNICRIHPLLPSPTATPPTISWMTLYYLFKTQVPCSHIKTYVKSVTTLLKTHNSSFLHLKLVPGICSCHYCILVIDHLLFFLSCWHHVDIFNLKNSHIFINSVKFSAIYF